MIDLASVEGIQPGGFKFEPSSFAVVLKGWYRNRSCGEMIEATMLYKVKLKAVSEDEASQWCTALSRSVPSLPCGDESSISAAVELGRERALAEAVAASRAAGKLVNDEVSRQIKIN